MTKQISIWRWRVADDLQAQFAALVAADAAGFNTIAAQMMSTCVEGLDGVEDTYAETEAKIRAMGLPADILETTLAGFRAMTAEADEERAALEQEFQGKDEDGEAEERLGVSLASSHMFDDDPFASLEYQEIDRQVNEAVAQYRAAISKVVGDEGQSFTAFLGIGPERLDDDDVFQTVMNAGFEGVLWVWVAGDAAFYLSQWHENKELPIDLEFSRVDVAKLHALKARI